MLFGFKYYLNRAQKHLSRWFFISEASPALGINAGWLFIRTLRLIFNNGSFVEGHLLIKNLAPFPPKNDAVKPFGRDLKL
jgi:hypothetical protein